MHDPSEGLTDGWGCDRTLVWVSEYELHQQNAWKLIGTTFRNVVQNEQRLSPSLRRWLDDLSVLQTRVRFSSGTPPELRSRYGQGGIWAHFSLRKWPGNPSARVVSHVDPWFRCIRLLEKKMGVYMQIRIHEIIDFLETTYVHRRTFPIIALSVHKWCFCPWIVNRDFVNNNKDCFHAENNRVFIHTLTERSKHILVVPLGKFRWANSRTMRDKKNEVTYFPRPR